MNLVSVEGSGLVLPGGWVGCARIELEHGQGFLMDFGAAVVFALYMAADTRSVGVCNVLLFHGAAEVQVVV